MGLAYLAVLSSSACWLLCLRLLPYGHKMAAVVLASEHRLSAFKAEGTVKELYHRVLFAHLSLYKEKGSFPEVTSRIPLLCSWLKLCHMKPVATGEARKCKYFFSPLCRKWHGRRWWSWLLWASRHHLACFIQCSERLFQGYITLTLHSPNNFPDSQVFWRAERLIPFFREALV